MTYVQGFVCAVPTQAREAFRAHAAAAAEGFIAHGAQSVSECWGDDVPDGEITSFPMAVAARPEETVVFSWMLWPSKEAHDEAMSRAFEDPRLNPKTNPMPFDGKRLIYGGFAPLFETGAARPGGYVDGFVMAVPRSRQEIFRDFCAEYDPVFLQYGANWIFEAWEEDVPDGEVTDFRRAVRAGADESVVFSFVQWPDKATRDEGMRRMMEDPHFAGLTMPFDGKRMIFGGFVPLVEA